MPDKREVDGSSPFKPTSDFYKKVALKGNCTLRTEYLKSNEKDEKTKKRG